MKLLFKQRFFSWLDSYDIYDENNQTVFSVEGKLSWGHRLHILDSRGCHIGTVKEKVLTFLPKFELYLGDNYIGDVKKEFTFFIPKFSLNYKGWRVDGDVFEWCYRVIDNNGRLIMTADKKLFNWTDTYEMNIANPGDAIYCLMIVLAIDAAKCSDKK